MKPIKRFATFGLVVGILCSPPGSLFAQQSGQINISRMERDLSIMEGILDNLIFNDTSIHFSSTRTRGMYLPGLGAVFQIPAGGTLPSAERESRGELIETTGKKEKDKPALLRSPEMVPIVEFLSQYADAMRDLPENEYVVVIYSPSSWIGSLPFQELYPLTGKKRLNPGRAIFARRSDISALRARKISEKQFYDRIRVVQLTPENQLVPDLRIMAQIFETGLGSYEDRSFRLSGKVRYFYLPEFGVLYTFDALFTRGKSYDMLINLEKYQKYMKVYEQRLREAEKALEFYITGSEKQKPAPLQKVREATKPRQKVQAWVLTTVEDSVLVEERMAAFRRFEERIREYMLDYGRTLKVLKPSQWMVVSVKMRSNYKHIPNRLVFQIRKSVLDQYDRRTLTRSQAMKQIRVTYYER